MRRLKNISDEELLSRCAHGEKQCMDALINRYADRVKAYIRLNVKRTDIAEDIFQETCLRVYLTVAAGKYNESGRFISWMIRIAHNLIVDTYRKERTARMIFDSECDYDLFAAQETAAAAEPNIEAELVRRQMLEDVGGFVRRLPESQRKVIEMRHYSDMSFKEIAEETSVSINTALGRMRYGIINLRRMMHDYERQCVG